MSVFRCPVKMKPYFGRETFLLYLVTDILTLFGYRQANIRTKQFIQNTSDTQKSFLTLSNPLE